MLGMVWYAFCRVLRRRRGAVERALLLCSPPASRSRGAPDGVSALARYVRCRTHRIGVGAEAHHVPCRAVVEVMRRVYVRIAEMRDWGECVCAVDVYVRVSKYKDADCQ